MSRNSRIQLVLACLILFLLTACARTPFSQGKVSFKAGDYDSAEAAFNKVVEAEPKSDNAYTALVYLARIQGIRKSYDEAIELVEKAIEMSPKSSPAYYHGCVLYQLKGDMGKAQKAWNTLSNMPQMGRGLVLAGINPPAVKLSDEKREQLEMLLR